MKIKNPEIVRVHPNMHVERGIITYLCRPYVPVPYAPENCYNPFACTELIMLIVILLARLQPGNVKHNTLF